MTTNENYLARYMFELEAIEPYLEQNTRYSASKFASIRGKLFFVLKVLEKLEGLADGFGIYTTITCDDLSVKNAWWEFMFDIQDTKGNLIQDFNKNFPLVKTSYGNWSVWYPELEKKQPFNLKVGIFSNRIHEKLFNCPFIDYYNELFYINGIYERLPFKHQIINAADLKLSKSCKIERDLKEQLAESEKKIDTFEETIANLRAMLAALVGTNFSNCTTNNKIISLL